MQKVVVNCRHGGFGLSHEACLRYAELSGFTLYPFVAARDKEGGIIWNSYVPYADQKTNDNIYYSKAPLVNGNYEDSAYWDDRNLLRNDPILIKLVE